MNGFWYFFLMIFISLLSCKSLTQENVDVANDFSTNAISISDSQIYFSMVHTPLGHMLQEAPYKIKYYEHLSIGTGPISVYSSLVSTIKEYYSFGEIPNSIFAIGNVSETTGKLSIVLNQPQESQLFTLPETVHSNLDNVFFAAAILFGKLNMPAFIDSTQINYWLRSSINELILKEDGQYNIDFTDLEMGVFVYYNKSCTLNGSQDFNEISYFYDNLTVKKGWNLIGLKIRDESEVFKGPRDVVVLNIDSSISNIYIPYW